MEDEIIPARLLDALAAAQRAARRPSALRSRPGGTVVAFEPGRHSFRLLATNVAAMNTVVVENLAVGSKTGNVEFHDFGLRNSALNTHRQQRSYGYDNLFFVKHVGS
jgi:FkbM family methyltransferase